MKCLIFVMPGTLIAGLRHIYGCREADKRIDHSGQSVAAPARIAQPRNVSAKANLLSTAAGVPFAWFVMVAIQFSTAFPIMSAANKGHWQIDDSPLEYVLDVLTMAWTAGSPRAVALAATLLLVPTFFVSVYLERRSYRRSWPDLDRAAVHRCVWLANVASYTLLFVAGCVWFGYERHAIYQ